MKDAFTQQTYSHQLNWRFSHIIDFDAFLREFKEKLTVENLHSAIDILSQLRMDFYFNPTEIKFEDVTVIFETIDEVCFALYYIEEDAQSYLN
ncbi:hypothetical protein [Mammaliicoccus vitulinus]|uniref:hypothetical protein n=1 Tax=Mammaliicoccus vitulinus TaxID=71237 RepID=UPI00248D3871|nr:hypothetical protein [Mammaliicoccus vitulinus]